MIVDGRRPSNRTWIRYFIDASLPHLLPPSSSDPSFRSQTSIKSRIPAISAISATQVPSLPPPRTNRFLLNGLTGSKDTRSLQLLPYNRVTRFMSRGPNYVSRPVPPVSPNLNCSLCWSQVIQVGKIGSTSSGIIDLPLIPLQAAPTDYPHKRHSPHPPGKPTPDFLFPWLKKTLATVSPSPYQPR